MEVIFIEPNKPEMPENSNVGVIQVYNNKEEPEGKESAICEAQGIPNIEGLQIRENINPENDKNQEKTRSESVVEIIGTSERKPPPYYSRYNHRRMSNEDLINGLSLWDFYVNMNKSSSILKHLNNSFVEVISAGSSYKGDLGSHSHRNGENLPPPMPGYMLIESSNNRQDLNNLSSTKHALSDLSANTSRTFLPAIAESSFEDEPSSKVTSITNNQNLILAGNKEALKETLDLVITTSQNHDNIAKSKTQDVEISTIFEHEKLNKIPRVDANIEKMPTVTSQYNLDKTSFDEVTDNFTYFEDVNNHNQSVIIGSQPKFYSDSENEEYYPREQENSSSISLIDDEMVENKMVTMNSMEDSKVSETTSNPEVDQSNRNREISAEKINLSQPGNILLHDEYEIIKCDTKNEEIQSIATSTSNEPCQDVIYIVDNKPDNDITVISNIEKTGESENRDGNFIMIMTKTLNHPTIINHTSLENYYEKDSFSTNKHTPKASLKDDKITTKNGDKSNASTTENTDNNKINEYKSNSIGFDNYENVAEKFEKDQFTPSNDHIIELNVPRTNKISVPTTPTVEVIVKKRMEEYLTRNLVKGGHFSSDVNVLPDEEDEIFTSQDSETTNQIALNSSPLLDVGPSIQEIQEAYLNNEKYLYYQSSNANIILDDESKIKKAEEISDQAKTITILNQISSGPGIYKNDVDKGTPNTNLDILNKPLHNYLDPSSVTNNGEQLCDGEQTNMKSKDRSVSSPTITVDFSTINSSINVKSDSLLEKCVKKFNLKPFFRKRKSMKHEESSNESDISQNFEAADDKPPSPNVVTIETVGDNSDEHSNMSSEDDLVASQQKTEETSYAVNEIQIDVTGENFGLNSQTISYEKEAVKSKTNEEQEVVNSPVLQSINNYDYSEVPAFNNLAAEDVVNNSISRNDALEHLLMTKKQGMQSIEIISERNCNLEEDRQATFLQFSPSVKVDP